MVEKKKISKFELGLELCEKYVQEFGDLKPKRTYVTDDGYPLGRWVLYQREKYNKNTLSQVQIDELEALGMMWSTENHGGGYSFEQKFEMYKNQLDSDDTKIKEFVWDLRSTKRNKGPYAGKLTEAMILELISIGFIFDLNESNWEDMYYSILSVYDEYGTVIKEYCSDKQWNWVRHQREKIDTLSDKKQRLLSEIGIGNNVKAEEWNKKFKCARDYYVENEHLLVPYEFIIGDIRLGEWITRQRKKYRAGIMEPYEIENLESIGMVWDVSEEAWMGKYQIAKKYFDTYGTIDVPVVFEFNGIQLGTWLYNQKQCYWNKTLSQEKKELLDGFNMNWEHKSGLNTSIREKIVAYYLSQIFEDIEFSYHSSWLGQKELDIFIPSLSLGIEYDGARWHTNTDKDLEKDLLCQQNGVNLIRIREPNAPVYDSKSLKLYLKDLTNKSLCVAIQQLVSMINLFYKTEYSLSMCFEKDYPEIVRLFAISQDDAKWMDMYSVAKEYFINHGDLLVPTNTIYQNKNLGSWILTQRQANKPNSRLVITDKQVDLLNQIGMVWDVYDFRFNENYELAKRLYERDGKLILNKHAGGEVAKIANWEYYTRRMKKDGKLSPDKLEKYNEIEKLITKDEDQ